MLELAIGITALMWTIYQQYQISLICMHCPYHPSNAKKLNDDTSYIA